MPKKRKDYDVSKDGRITVYPALHETKEKGNLKRIIKKLIHIKKGHWGLLSSGADFGRARRTGFSKSFDSFLIVSQETIEI